MTLKRNNDRGSTRGIGVLGLKNAFAGRPVHPLEVSVGISPARKLPSLAGFRVPPPALIHHKYLDVYGFQVFPKAAYKIAFRGDFLLPVESWNEDREIDFFLNSRDHQVCGVIGESTRGAVIQSNMCNTAGVVNTVNIEGAIVCDRELLLKSLCWVVGDIWIN